MKFLKDIAEGRKTGIKARKLSTEFRLNGIDPWEAEKEESPYFEKVQKLKKKDIFGFRYMGLMIGQLQSPREWFRNSQYLFENDSN